MHSDRYARLDATKIIATVDQLAKRIGDRFPEANLRVVCERLVVIAHQASERSVEIGRPIFWMRIVSATLAGLIILSFVGTLVLLAPQVGHVDFFTFVSTLESGLSELVLLGAAILFLVTFESRVRRDRVLAALHELRSLAHIIDMHQLTKDPERILFVRRMMSETSDPIMSPFELDRYLDYCSEMLAMIGKISVLYVQHFEDSQAVAAVNDIEQLTSGLSRKIWQKIMILHQVCGSELIDDAIRDSAKRNTLTEADVAESAPAGRG